MTGMAAIRFEPVAVIGMAGRFPGARDVEEFWENLRAGRESITTFTPEELVAAGVDAALVNDRHYVRAGAVLEDIDMFDASFFGYFSREAEVMDPQQRVFLESAWEALEHAGYDSSRYRGRVGVFAGAAPSAYLLEGLAANPGLVQDVGRFHLAIVNDTLISTCVSYKLDLKGPSINVNTACSSSLVAVHYACQSLLNDECDMALAGGVAVNVQQAEGYLYQEGGMTSPDGHCRAFDARGQGTIFGSGVGLVVLKKLSRAQADGDRVHAVIKGSAVNNDGSLKAGYTAPSVEGQAQVIAQSHRLAEVRADSIGYVEAHGTATALGDPCEIRALEKVFRADTDKKGFCAIGSVKTNVGHLNAAAGITGLIKTVLSVKHRIIPASLHFEVPNPEIDFAGSPFYVNDRLSDWPAQGVARRAGVSSQGIGGTNVHVVVEEAPPPAPPAGGRSWQLVVLSAKTESALERTTERCAAHFERLPDEEFADAAYTLQTGRRAFDHRRFVLCRDRADAVEALVGRERTHVQTAHLTGDAVPVAFLFPGEGTQYVGMGSRLYQGEPVFREHIDRCSQIVRDRLGIDLREAIHPDERCRDEASARLRRSDVAQPALFAVEYALARLWMDWGVQPQAMLGHDVGEYVAACLSGVLSLEDALEVVAQRGRLIEQQPPGAMLGVPAAEDEVRRYLDSELSVAAVAAPALSMVSGPEDAVAALQARLERQGITGRRPPVSHALHSAMMDGVVGPFSDVMASVALNPPEIPYVANVTGTWATGAQATDPGYWASQLRRTVRFLDGLGELCRAPGQVLLEVGPGTSLSHGDGHSLRATPSLPPEASAEWDEESVLLDSLGQLWLAGVKIDWTSFHRAFRRRRVPLPTYPFERRRYWISRSAVQPAPRAEAPRPPRSAVPTGESEVLSKLGELWGESLGMREVDPEENFFELGGHSLAALQLMSTIGEVFGVEIPLSRFFEDPTLAHLGALVLEKQTCPARPAERPAAPPAPDPRAPDGSREAHAALTERGATPEPAAPPDAGSGMELSLFFFSSDEHALRGARYDLVLECTRFADEHGFCAVWTPERHFYRFGGLYPNPSVLSAALAVASRRLRIRAGSVVLPLHHPVRVVEEWSVVDNLSGGRVGLSFAPGFSPTDFALSPETFDRRYDVMFERLDRVRSLWRGEALPCRDGVGNHRELTAFPRPLQEELPVWITIGKNPELFAKAGRMGLNVLTALLTMSVEELAERIELYREALAQHGHAPGKGKVTLMIHSYVGEDLEAVKEKVRGPFVDYLRSHSELMTPVAQSLHGFNVEEVSEADREALLNHSFERYFNARSLMGTVDTCVETARRLSAVGVDEIACLVDFGIDSESLLGGLRRLNELRAAWQVPAAAGK